MDADVTTVIGMPSPSSPLPAPDNLDSRARSRIKHWMSVSQITQVMLAERIGKDQSWLSRYLAGAHDADVQTLARLAAAFGNTLFTLLDIPPDPQDARVLEMFRALSPATQGVVLHLLESLTRAARRRGRRAPR